MDNSGQIPAAWGPASGPELSDAGIWRHLRGNSTIIFAGVLALTIALTALLVPLLPLQDPLLPDYTNVLQAPGAGHLLGTDLHGRDELSRVLWASRTSLLVGLFATGLALVAGVAVGGLAGYGGRYIDPVLMRTTDIFLSFPVILGAIAILAIFGTGRRNVFFAIAFFAWPIFARVFRSRVLSVREREYVKAARLLGASERRIFFTHVLPNAAGPLITYTAMAVAGAILAEAGLSFIGLGVQPPYPAWGLMLAESMGLFERASWLVLAPGLAVTLTSLSFILLGAAATRAMDPRDRSGGR